MRYTDEQSLVQYIKSQGLTPKKSFGQNFLIGEGIYDAILDGAKLNPEDIVIEVGPGLGTLTKQLCAQAKQVIAIEKDTSLLPHVQNHTKEYDNLTLINEDILQVALPSLHLQRYKVIANIPYYITSPIIFAFLHHTPKPDLMVLLMQKEVAQRIVTVGKGGSVISVLVQAYGTPTILRDVAAKNFFPPPKITSSILQITPYTTPRIKSNPQYFEKMVKIGFSQKRKMLAHNLHATFRISKELSRQIIEKCDIPGDLRAERLTIEQWDALTLLCTPLFEEGHRDD